MAKSLAFLAVVLIVLGVAMTGAGALLANMNFKIPSLSSVTFLGVPIDMSFAGGCYAGQPFPIHAYISESDMGPPVPIGGATLIFTIVPAGGGAAVATGSAVSDVARGEATWTWQNPAVGNYLLSVDWAGDAAHTAGGHTGNVPIGVVLPTRHTTLNAPNPYLKYLNILTLPGLVLLIVGAVALPVAIRGKKGSK
jgi:hypothetical protein